MWCVVIFYFTESPTFTGENTQKILDSHVPSSPEAGEPVKYLNVVVRKSTHLIAFGILAFFVWKAMYPKRWAYVGAWAIATFYGGIDEWHQSYIPGRSASVNDVLIDSLGALVVLILVSYGIHQEKSTKEFLKKNSIIPPKKSRFHVLFNR